ncbi:MAG TPA: hypothetical protein VHY21_02680 [Pseudonocardiaceae bacterium]|nr:hypothetical protein [Pseudonocardiaceae bacterium]
MTFAAFSRDFPLHRTGCECPLAPNLAEKPEAVDVQDNSLPDRSQTVEGTVIDLETLHLNGHLA